ncbi:MAG: membrane lipoprotein lipid attachment site-containing protein [Ilyomonas sp.]
MKKIIFSLLAMALLSACQSNPKKIIVMSKGKATIDKDAKTISVPASGSGHEEQTIEFNSADKISLQVNSPAGNTTVEIQDNGYYILNAKTDTIVGGYVYYGAPEDRSTVVSQDEVKKRIDSIQQLITNQNTGITHKTFFILPNTAVKITDNVDATIIGPYHQITSIQQEGDKKPEVYRFYPIKDARETLDKLKSFTVAPPSPNQ